MPSEPKRKLAAIMFTDMVGYTALMQDDEPKARELIQRHRELMKPMIEKHSGIILQYVGDGTFITFDSAIEAVNCGYEIQNQLKEDKDLSLRIGIHIGDVVVDGDEVYGDGVNVASRLEPLAEAGGVCISEKVYDEIRNQPEIETVFLGEKTLKNVDNPIKVYCLAGEGLSVSEPFSEKFEAARVAREEVSQEVVTKSLTRRIIPWSVGAIVVFIALFGLRWFGDREIGQQAIAGENSIAVMYFENLTGDPSLNWIEAGMVEMLTANLGRLEGLDVLSSQRLYDIMRQVSGKESTARKIDRSTATEIARKAGVQLMLLGSVLGTDGRLRLSTQLVEVPTGKLVGAEVLDASADGSIFSLVDSLTIRIAGHLGVLQPERPVEANVAYTLTNSLEALRLYVEGVQALNRFTFARAIKHLEAAVELDSTFAMAYFQLGLARGWLGSEDALEAFEKAGDHADKVSERERLVIEVNLMQAMEGGKKRQAYEQIVKRYPDEKYAWYQLGELLYHSYWPRASVNAFLRAIELDQFFLLAYVHPIDFYIFTGQIDKARPLLSEALTVDSLNVAMQWLKAELDYTEGKTIEAAEGFGQVIKLLGPDSEAPHALLAKAKLAIMERDFGKAEILLNTGRDATPTYSVLYTNYLAGLALFQGKYNLAEHYLEEAAEDAPNSIFQTYENGLFELLRGRTRDAKSSAQKILEVYNEGEQKFPEVAVLGMHLLFLTALDEGNEEEAQQVLLELESLVIGNENEYDFLYYDALGRFECSNGDEEMAQEHFTQALNTATFTGWDTFISFRHLILEGLMECLEREGFYEKLLQLTEELPPAPMVVYWPSASTHALWPRSLMRKALAYEKLGKTNEAIEAYDEFLDLWKDADEGIPDRKKAIRRLAALRQGS